MGLAPDVRAATIASTRGAAEAYIEDIAYLRELPNLSQIPRAELRRMSGILRRLLIDSDIAAIAPPRIGRFVFLAPDNRMDVRESKTKPYRFCATASVPVGNISVANIGLLRGPATESHSNASPKKIRLRIDEFLSQFVLCLEGTWINRKDTIKYAANISSGVHSGAPKKESEKLLRQLRRRYRYSVEGDSFQIRAQMEADVEFDPPLTYEPRALDPVLLELHDSAKWLLKSHDTVRLEKAIRAEIGT